MARVEFGNFADGTIGGEIRDTSWNWSTSTSAGHQKVTMLAGGGLNGGNAVRLIGDDSMIFSGQGARVRIHGIGIKGGEPSWWPAGTNVKQHIVRVLALRVPSGASFANPEKVTTDEQHGPNGSGSVMNPCLFGRTGSDKFWRHYVRGNTVINNTYAFQWIFGPNDSSPVGANNNHQDWAGGNLPVTFDQWVVFVYSELFGPDGTGSFEAWHRTPADTGWVHSVPKKSNIYVGYPTSNTPFMSLYYASGSGSWNAVDYCGGAYFGGGATEQANIDEAFTWSNARFGFSTSGGGGGVSTVVAAPGNNLIGVTSVDTAVATTLNDLADYKRGSPTPSVVPADAGLVTYGYEFGNLVAPAAAAPRKLAIYQMNGSGGTPGSLIAVSQPSTMAAATSPAWQPYQFSPPVDLSPYVGQTLLLATLSQDSNVFATYRTIVTGKQQLRLDSYATGPSDPWAASVGGGYTGVYDNELALVLAYTPAAGGVAPVAVIGQALGNYAIVQFDQTIDTASTPPASAFKATINGVSFYVPDLVTVSTNSITIPLPVYLAVTDVATVSYTAPGTSGIRDAATGTLYTSSFTIGLANVAGPAPRFHQVGARVFVPGARYSAPSQRRVGVGGGF